MAKRMLIDALHSEETRVAIADESQIYDFDFVSTAKKQLKGNIYLAKVTRVEPSLQAAFVEYGGGKQGFLPFAEIHTDYYQIPFSDRQKLLEEAAREMDPEYSPVAGEAGEGSENIAENAPEAQEVYEKNAGEFAREVEANQEEIVDQDMRPAYVLQGAIELSASEEDKLVDAMLLPVAQEEGAGQVAEEAKEGAIAESEAGEAILVSEPSEDMFETAASLQAEEKEAQGEESTTEATAEDVETVETNAREEESMGDRRKRNVFMRRYKIQEVIRRGQVVLVQVIKEERGNKGVSLTTYLSLAGRYCVLMPNSPKDGGISRKIAGVEDRKRLKAISTEFRLAEGMSVIIRTAGMDRTHAEIKRDFDYLVNLWNSIREETLKSNAPALIYEEGDIVKRAIRDQYSSDIDEILVEGESAFNSAREFMKLLMPSHTSKIKKYEAGAPLFYAYGIEEQLTNMHEPVVKMRSGAYLVINPTEALISIDVNSGRATGERNIEETALKTNLEAAAEVARQLRLRDLAGLVVIDFIDMVESRNRRAVEKMLKDSMKQDRAKIQLGRISPFGLLEMSRQRLRPSISETSMTECPHCAGRGVIRSNESMAIQIIRAIEKEASNANIGVVRVLAPQNTAMYILNNKREIISDIEKRYGVSVQILIDTALNASDFSVERMRRGNERGHFERADAVERSRSRRQERGGRKQQQVESTVQPAQETADETSTEEGTNEGGEWQSASEGNKSRRSRNRRRGRRLGRGEAENAGAEASENSATDADSADENADSADITADGKPESAKRDRGSRGRRKWRDRGGEGKADENAVASAPAADIPTRWDGGAAAFADGKELPNFAIDSAPVAVPAPPTYKAYHDHKPELELAEAGKPADSANGDSQKPANPKRGWWQRMISLDD